VVVTVAVAVVWVHSVQVFMVVPTSHQDALPLLVPYRNTDLIETKDNPSESMLSWRVSLLKMSVGMAVVVVEARAVLVATVTSTFRQAALLLPALYPYLCLIEAKGNPSELILSRKVNLLKGVLLASNSCHIDLYKATRERSFRLRSVSLHKTPGLQDVSVVMVVDLRLFDLETILPTSLQKWHTL
jgi:hypothetical protein